MNKYPKLTEMGIRNPQQILRYAVNSLSNVDYLVISYSRPAGSFLPVSRTYEFPRVQRTVKATKDGEKDYEVLESNPALTKAVEELETIVQRKTGKEEIVKAMQDELRHMDEEFTRRTATLRSLIDALRDGETRE